MPEMVIEMGNLTAQKVSSPKEGHMHTVAKWMLAAATVCASGGAAAQVYDLNFKVSGEQITGSITVGGETGTLAEPDITAFTFYGTGTNTFALSGTSLYCNGGGGCGLTANGGTLQFGFGSGSVYEDIFNCQNPGYCGFLSMNSAGVYGSGNGAVTFDVSGQGTGQWEAQNGLSYLTLPPVPAPEIDPGCAASGVALLTGCLVVLNGRKRQSMFLRP
jgi:hypothetical protein